MKLFVLSLRMELMCWSSIGLFISKTHRKLFENSWASCFKFRNVTFVTVDKNFFPNFYLSLLLYLKCKDLNNCFRFISVILLEWFMLELYQVTTVFGFVLKSRFHETAKIYKSGPIMGVKKFNVLGFRRKIFYLGVKTFQE